MLSFLIALIIGSSVITLAAPTVDQPISAYPDRLSEYLAMRRLGDKYFDEGLYPSARKTYLAALDFMPEDYEDEEITERINVITRGIDYVKGYLKAIEDGTVEEYLHPKPSSAGGTCNREPQVDPETGEVISKCSCNKKTNDDSGSKETNEED